MGNEASQISGQEGSVDADVSHKRSQSLQRGLTSYNPQNSSDTAIALSSSSRKSQSHTFLCENFPTDEIRENKPSPKLIANTSTTGLALLKTVQMELTDEEKERIQQVLARARLVEMKEGERITKLQIELKRTEQDVRRRVSLSNQDVTKQVNNCTLCEQTPSPICQRGNEQSSLEWRVCQDCQNSFCPNCIVQIGKSLDTEKFWLCKLCQKKRQLVASSGSWLQGLAKTDNKQTKTIQKILRKTHGITRTASYSQYEDLIDQVSLDELSVTSGQEEHEDEEVEDERDEVGGRHEQLQDILQTSGEFSKTQINISQTKSVTLRRASEQIGIKDNKNMTRRLNDLENVVQSINTETSKMPMNQQPDIHIIDNENDANNNNDQITSREDRVHLYFTKQISENVDEIDKMSDKGEQNYKSYHHSESATNTSYNSHKEPFLCVNKPSNVAHSDRLETFDDIDSAVSSIIIDEKVGEDENYAQTSCTQISYNDQSLNSTQTVSSFSHVSSTDICQVTPKHIISSVEPKNHCNLISSSKTKDIGKYEQIIHDSSAYEYESTIDYNRYVDFDSFHFYPPDYTNFNELDAFDANSLMNQNIHCIQDTKISPVNIQQDYNIDLMDDNHILIEEESKIKKLRDSTQYQNDPTIFGLIIPQSSNDDNEEEDYISKSEDEFIQDNETDSKRLSKHLDAINVKNECSNYLSSQLIDYYMRRQSYPTSNDTEISSTISSKLSSRRERYLISQFSYFDQNEYDFDDTDDVSTLTFLEDQHNTPIKSQSNRPEHDKLTSTNMDLIFPYSLEEPWDYAEDLRKIDEDIYKRTTPPDTTTTTDGIVSSITSLDKHNIINSGISTNVASNDNYYTDNVMRSSFSDYENVHSLDKQSVNMSQFHTVERSMNELYLNWLNDLNMSYYRDQQDNLTKNDYNVKTNDYNYTELPFSDHNTSQSITSNLVTSEASITPSSTSNSKAIIATTSSTTEQNVILKRCPNFENISCLSSGSEIDLTQHDSDVYGTSMNVSDMNEEKEDIEINNDKPMKVWGREYRDKLQTVDPSTCLTNIYNNIQPELDIWSNLFNTSEIVVDTAREISAQLNFLSSLEGSEREEAGGDGKEREREIITHRISHKDDDNRTEMLTDQMLATVATTTTVTSVTTSESSHQHISCNEDIIENIEKYGGIVSSHIITCPTFPVQTSQKLISYDQGENISYSESLSSVTKSAVSKHSNRYTDIIEENVANPTVSTFLSNKTTSNEFHPYGKFSSDANQSMQTLLQKNNHLMKTGEKREEKVEKTEDLYHSDTFELYEHVIPMNFTPLLDNYSTHNIIPDNDNSNNNSNNNMDEKGIIKEILSPYHYEQAAKNPMHTYIDPSQGSSIDFGEEGRSMKSANHKEVRKSSLQLDEAPHTTSFVRLDSDQSLQYPIDQSNFNNSQSSIYQFQCFNNKYGDKFLTEPNLIFNKRYNEIAYTQGEYGTFLKDDLNLRIVACSKSSDISSKLLGNHFFTRENTSCEINVSNCQLPKTTGSPHLSVKQTITGSSTKSSCYSSEKALKRAQLILSTSPVDEPDPTDTFLALTDSNNTSGDRFSRLHEKDLSKSPIKSYFLSLSCPQSLSSQLIDDNNYDTLSECSNFSIHIPVPSSKYNENVLSESQLSSPLNFDEFYANRNLWEPFHSHWYIHILKRISQETILTSIPEQTSDNENIHTEYMSSSSSSRGSYFAPQRRRPHSSTYSYEVNTFGDDLPGAYESPNSSSSAVYLGQSYNNHKSLHDIYPDRSVRQLDYNDSYRTNVKVSPKSNLKGHYNNRPYRSYSQASTSFQPKDKVGVASVIRHDHRSKLGLIHPPGRFKHLKSVDIETALQQRILKEASRGPKPFSGRNSEKPQDFTNTSRFNKIYQDYETGPRLRRAPLRSYTPTYKALQTPQSKWSNDPSYLETGSYFSLPLHDYQRQATKYSRSSSTNRRHAPSSTDTSLHRRILSDEWDHFSRNIGKLSKSTGHLSHLDDLGKISGCTSMQTLRARLAAAHSEFNLDDQEELSDSIHSQRFKSERFGSLDRQIGSNELTTRQLRRQVEQHHRRLLKSLMTDEPFEPSWPSSFSTFNLQNVYPESSEMRPTTLISSTLAPPIFSTATTRLPLNIEQSKLEGIISEPSNYMSSNDQFISIPSILTAKKLNSTNPLPMSNSLSMANNLIGNIDQNVVLNQPTSVSANQSMTVTNNSLVELINNPEFLQALSYNPSLVDQINSMCVDLGPTDLNQVTLAAVAGAIAATAVAGSGMLENTQSVNDQSLNNLLQNVPTADQLNVFPSSGNFVSNINDFVDNPSNLNSAYLNTVDQSNTSTSGVSNIPRISNLSSDMNNIAVPSVDTLNPDSIDILIEQVRKLLDEQNSVSLMTTAAGTTTTTCTNNTSYGNCFLPSPACQTGQSVMNMERTQNFNNICETNFQKSPRTIHQSSDLTCSYRNPSETIDSWLGLSEDEWNYKTSKDNTRISDSWTDVANTWPAFSSLQNNKTKLSMPITKCTYDFPTKRLLLMRESKDRHQKGGGIGMRIVGGHIRSDGNLGAFVEEIYPTGPADQLHGEIKEGDEILEWNSIPLVGKTFEEVQAIISQVSEETELLVRADYAQGDDEVDDDGEDMEDEEEEEEDEEYDEEYIDDDDEQQDDEDVQSSGRNCGSESTGNSGQRNKPHALCHHHAAQHALMNRSKGPICPHMRQHYLAIPSSDHRSTSQTAHNNPHKLHLTSMHNSTNEQQIQDDEDAGITLNKSQMHWFEADSPGKIVERPSSSTIQDSKYSKKSITMDTTEVNNDRRSSKGGRRDGRRESHLSHHEKNEDSLEYGEIELILTFDDYDQSLTVHVARARNLPSMDLNGLADPFVKVRLHPDPTEDPDFNRQTKYMPNTLTPEWQQTVVFMNCIKRTLKRRVLEVTVWDFDRLKTNDFMGQTIINLGDKEYLDGKPHWFSLHKLLPVIIPTSKKSVSSSKTSSDSSRQAKSSKDSNSRKSLVNKPSRDQIQSQRMNT